MNRFLLCALATLGLFQGGALRAADELRQAFDHPPVEARPWVYWYFMDGNLTREGITADLEAMKAAGIGGAIYLEVGIGIPRGPVEFMSKPWQELLGHAFSEADRLGLQIALASGPGWCGTGGPWVPPELAMQDLVASETPAAGGTTFDAVLPQPQPRPPFFGEKTMTPEGHKMWQEFYKDVAVIAFPTPAGNAKIADTKEKALFARAPYSSSHNVKPSLTAPADLPAIPADQCIDPAGIVDLSKRLGPDGKLRWDVPPGQWTIMRMGRTLTGQTTRPSPEPGLGFETDKFNPAAIDAHFASYIETLLKTAGEPKHPGRGLTTLHFDSWEMSSQNWSGKFREEFTKRRGYDPLPFLPAMQGRVVSSPEKSERFLWDLRQTAQELVVENQALRLRDLGRKHGLQFSLEPYDLNPTSDLTLGSAADVPMGEFWSKGYGFATEFSCFEATSVGHTNGHPIIGAEAFTANANENWHQFPGSMKQQGDWAFCCGINRFAFHRYQAQPKLDEFPGMTMGHYGVHWERTQTWWDLVDAYHLYLSRCQQMLRQGLFVADILYLTPEGAPNVFRPPTSAAQGKPPDRPGYNFDGCAPDNLIAHASVKDGRIVFPDGMSYRVLVLPRFDTMTPGLLTKISQLVDAGATVVGAAPLKSPSLQGYPACDQQVQALAARLWNVGASVQPEAGKGRVIKDPSPFVDVSVPAHEDYQPYDTTAATLVQMGVEPDFQSDGDLRYIHRRTADADFYFVANRATTAQTATCRFRVTGKRPEWWDPATGECRDLPEYTPQGQLTAVPVRLAPLESGFVVFRHPVDGTTRPGKNFPELRTAQTLTVPWEVSFDPKWGGPAKAEFAALDDWSKRPEEGIQHYSGKAMYRTTFDAAPDALPGSPFLSLGTVKNLASVKLNGKDLGTVWCDPWQVRIPEGTLRAKGNVLEITVANLWINRLIADSALPPDKRLTQTTYNPYKPNSPLEKSGLLGPVTIQTAAGNTPEH